MSDPKFTPGPWKKAQNAACAGSIATVYHGDGKAWFDISAVNINYDTFLEQQQYNTDLIVSAPDLYASLNRALDALERAADYGVPGLGRAIDAAYDAIRKAEGES